MGVTRLKLAVAVDANGIPVRYRAGFPIWRRCFTALTCRLIALTGFMTGISRRTSDAQASTGITDAIGQRIELIRVWHAGAVVEPVVCAIRVLIHGLPIHSEFNPKRRPIDERAEFLRIDPPEFAGSSNQVDIDKPELTVLPALGRHEHPNTIAR
jgi:hypothetical protein